MDYCIDIQCLFINGSDARGCKVVIVSDHPSVANQSAMVMRRNESKPVATASGQLNLTFPIDCYHHVLAFDIEEDDSISTLAIMKTIPSTTPLCPFTAAGKNYFWTRDQSDASKSVL